MDKFTFDENKLEQLLQSMPKVRDHQTPEQLFASISSSLEEKIAEDRPTYKNRKKQKPSWIVPAFASVAALLLLALVVPSFLQQNSTMENSQVKLMEEPIAKDKAPIENEAGQLGAEMRLFSIAPESESRVLSVIPEQEEVITVAVPDENIMFVVPLSFTVPKGEKLAQVETINELLNEQEWGLSQYILEDVSLSEGQTTNGDKKIILDVPADHSFGKGSAMEVIFIATVKETFRQLGYDVVEFTTAGKPGITLGNYGDLNELNLTNEETENVYYLYQPNEQIQPFLVPFPRENDFTKALAAMKSTTDLEIREVTPSIPEEVQFSNVIIENESGKVTIAFEDGTPLMNESKYKIMIEAILMTAKEFGFDAVQFENAAVDIIGPYELSKPIHVPIAVNPMGY
ncbi:GerMN domain-containing protein [Calidifontibacillus oryziterrae]|uniref:GerMN domain-containing protein n=1 Tax=Calidifontibacillus oryziterrae TaxID=1191699 RepID=UPI0002F80220|nr:GerMN domain-containing protein [Calidifontibacillus oryziterrae]